MSPFIFFNVDKLWKARNSLDLSFFFDIIKHEGEVRYDQSSVLFK